MEESVLYRLARPLFFMMKAEQAHHFVMGAARLTQSLPLGWMRGWLSHQDKRLEQDLFGCHFASPVGLAAGMDKNAEFVRFWQMLGLGFVEIGSVTAEPSDGNAQPRLFRLPKDEALINRMGLNNEGAQLVARRLAREGSRFRLPVGINLAKTHSPSILGQKAIDDFVESYKLLSSFGAYVALNVSCPNTEEGKTFEDPASLDALLEAVGAVRKVESEPRPLVVKLSPPPSDDWQPDGAFDEMLDVLRKHQVDGLIVTNTASDRKKLLTSATRIEEIGRGGLSGRPLQHRSRTMMAAVYTKTEGSIPLIGVGGIDSPEAAYKMIRAGASLVELYTALIYKGPGLIPQIQKGLIKRLTQDGFGHISEAVGADHRPTSISK